MLQYAYQPKHLSLIVKTGGRYPRRPNPLADMYILIDRDQMKITHKHRDRRTLNFLSWIECTNSGLVMDLSSVKPLLDFTPAELRLLYQNATDGELKGYANTLAQVVLAMARRLPETECNPDEVKAQADTINDGDKSIYSYLPGSMVPSKHEGLFAADSLRAQRVASEEAAAISAPVSHVFGGTASASSGANTQGAPSETRAPSAPKPGGTREVIFRVADEMWSVAGSPMNKNIVLELRKRMMQELESNHGVKKTTSSTALGDWQKSRVA